MNRDDDPELWELLGRAAEPKISPFFARNVLREIRKINDWKTFRGWFQPRRLIPVAGVVVILIAAVLLRFHTLVAPLAEPLSETLATVDAMEFEIIADLDELLTSDDNNLLEESLLL